MIQIEEFKLAVGKYPTGVCVVSTALFGELYGFTANSFTSVSLSPALISFCLNIKTSSFSAFINSKYFVINILSQTQGKVADQFSSHGIDKFHNIKYTSNDFGVPMILDVLSTIECEKYSQTECGDHYIFVGKVLKTNINNSEKEPLIYYNKSYRELK